MTHYETIEQAITYINSNYKFQPSLEEIAEHVGLSPFYFQKTFQEWAGVTPKKFIQCLTAERAKELLLKNQSLLDTSMEIGLSGPSRLHDLFITTEGMTPGEYKNGAKDLTIHYSFADTRFGQALIASTTKGVCYLAFVTEPEGIQDLTLRFPKARFKQANDYFQKQALEALEQNKNISDIKLHLKGTPFQLKVWQALLHLPTGTVGTYEHVARAIGQPTSARAVGNAVGANPVAYIIPCHRVIRATGIIGNYRWGKSRKQAMLGWEASRDQL